MNRLTRIFLALCLTSAASAGARTILTSQGADDYAERLRKQPEIESRIAIPDRLSTDEADALKFLYAYISTPDALDYDSDFFLENIRMSLKAAEEMPWGAAVPDREWRHFVLPVRVNNENLDMSRRVFYDELKERVKELSMEEAILEVNHWCHEKVSYQPSDGRTSSPLTTVCNALGRCGEESTFTVAALRSVGIPARQVYTPRWAHTDDNHAWVEAWADGKWHFLGACEPEAVLDLGWFNAPAARGMLMSTNVTGVYDGPEEQLAHTPISTVINVTANYAPVTRSAVYIIDRNGNPVKDASVRFSLYNYAEFYPLAIKKTDADGYAEFTSGLGDMVVWASDGSLFNLAPLSAGDTLRLVLDKETSFSGVLDFDIVPPPPGGKQPEVSAEAARINEARKVREDSIRLSYVATFLSPEQAGQICDELGLGAGAADLLVKSRGNHGVITGFLRVSPEPQRAKAISLLGALAEKDLHDITTDVLEDNVIFTQGDESSPLFVPYVLNPRIELELLRPFKKAIRSTLTADQIAAYSADPRRIEADLRRDISADSLYNPGGYRQSATATLANRTADALNRSIAFVAICRSLGIPARIDPVSHTTQFADNSGTWHDVTFDAAAANDTDESKGTLNIENLSTDIGREPKYYSQFTISRIAGGAPELMEFDDFESLESINERRQPLDAGQYVLVTGQRMADGSVLARANFFGVAGGELARPQLFVRQDSTALQVIGSLDAESLFTPLASETRQSILATTGRGYYVLGLIAPGHEPSAHALNDIAASAEELSATGRTMLLLFADAESAARFRAEDYGKLPDHVVFGIDTDGIAERVSEGLELPGFTTADMPVLVVADTFNRIVFANRGYSIHLGDTLARILRSVE